MMRFQKIIIFISVFFIVFSTLTGCSNEKRLAGGSPLRTMDPVSILNKVDDASLVWDWLGMKVETDIRVNNQAESLTLSVRIKRDSAIWISLSPALGVEIARVMLLTDSVKVISKVPLNKFVFEGGYLEIENLLGIPFDFNSFQDLFSGTSLELDPFNDKYASEVDGLNYMLIEKIPRRVKKLIEGVSDRKADRLINKAEVSELIVKSYWFDGLGFTPVMDVFRHVESGLYVKVKRFGNEGHHQGYLPSETKITAAGDGVDLDCTLTVKRSRVNKEYTMPFDPPANYERRKSL
jgi:hypothetical protein